MKTENGRFQCGAKLEWESGGEGIRRQIMGYDGQLMVVKVEFVQGATATTHEHYHSQVTYVVSGKFEVHIDGEKQIVSAGDGFYVAPDLVHGAHCIEAGTLIDTFSPHRADFLKK